MKSSIGYSDRDHQDCSIPPRAEPTVRSRSSPKAWDRHRDGLFVSAASSDPAPALPGAPLLAAASAGGSTDQGPDPGERFLATVSLESPPRAFASSSGPDGPGRAIAPRPSPVGRRVV